MANSHAKYDSTVNVVGSIPDYSNMIDYINQTYGMASAEDRFVFRTSKATSRFKKAVSDGFICFGSENHRALFLEALTSQDYSAEEKLIILFWQFIYCNALFRDVTKNVFLKALYSGRTSIAKNDIEAYLKHLKRENPEDMPWSDSTIAITASKYLTILKKFGFADGRLRKEIHAPHMSSSLFVLMIRLSLAAYPDIESLENPMLIYSFLDRETIIKRLKSIDYIPLWNITQIGNNITISLK